MYYADYEFGLFLKILIILSFGKIGPTIWNSPNRV